MLSQSQRAAILELNTQKVSKREIARVLKVSRLTVREVLRSGSAEVPALARAEICDPYRQQILELLPMCKGNLVRVQEELLASGANLSYSALTAFCRRHGIGHALPRFPDLKALHVRSKPTQRGRSIFVGVRRRWSRIPSEGRLPALQIRARDKHIESLNRPKSLSLRSSQGHVIRILCPFIPDSFDKHRRGSTLLPVINSTGAARTPLEDLWAGPWNIMFAVEIPTIHPAEFA
jgi:hypothetical protein